MKKQTAIAMTLGVWALALSSAVALAYDLNRPLGAAEGAGAPSAMVAAVSHERVSEAPRLHSATLGEPNTVTSPRPVPRAMRPAPAAPVATEPKLPDISAMSCAEWRSLDMGSGRVQVCEAAP